jgi:hypothetical protein
MGTADALHNRSVTDDAFYEWLLSDHPDAKAERERRRSMHYQRERDTASDITAWADRISTDPGPHTQAARGLAARMAPHAARSAARAEISAAEPDDLYVARLRAEFERHMRLKLSGAEWSHPNYRYPDYLLGPSAANYSPPPSPETPEPDRDTEEDQPECATADGDPETRNTRSATPPRQTSATDAEPEAEAGF